MAGDQQAQSPMAGGRLLALPEARARVLAACPRSAFVAVPVPDVLGCVLGADVVAEEDVPPFANTAMDGYALRAADTAGAPVTLAVVGTIAAGDPPDLAVGPGQAVRIMTGAPIPPGADAVVMVERTRALDDGGRVQVAVTVGPGNHIRPVGDDLRAGQTVFPAGTVVGPVHLGVLASLGITTVEAHPRLRVGVLSTGDELVDAPPGGLRPGQIRDANRPMLLALLQRSGFQPVDLGRAPDTEDAIAAAIGDAVAGCDALLTSGGVSVGDFDHVKAVLDRLGAMQWMQIAIKPAKPFAFGLVQGVPVFGLPGNPVSSMVSFELLARPALRQMAGHRALDRPSVRAVATDALRRSPDGKTHYQRAVATLGSDGGWQVRSAGGQGSHQLAALATANAFAVLPDGDGVAAGELVSVILLESP